jgi:heptosyltransferase-2
MRYGLLNDIRKLNKSALPKTVDRFVALGLPKNDTRLGKLTPYPHLSPGNAEYVLRRLNLPYTAEQPLLALCPGAEYGPAKRWPLEHFAHVAKEKIAQGWQVWIFGSATKKEIELGARIQTLVGENCINLCGKTQLGEAIDLLALARVVVSNDSGLMHIAAALGKPLIALYGSSSPDMTPPLTNKAHIVYLRLHCSPCFERSCPLGHLQCLRAVTPQSVLGILKLYD